MAKNTMILRLQGEVTLKEFSKAILEFTGLINELNKEVASNDEIKWVITDLQSSSAITTIEGVYDKPEPVERIVNAFESVGESLSAGKEIPYSARVRKRAEAITNIINGGITSVEFETEDNDYLISSSFVTDAYRPTTKYSYGSVKGIVETLSKRRKMRFILWDTLFDKPVSCYFNEDQYELVRNIWGKRVIISGKIGRQPDTGLPTVIKDISDISILEDIPNGTYKKARGAFNFENAEKPEDTIRRLRDGKL